MRRMAQLGVCCAVATLGVTPIAEAVVAGISYRELAEGSAHQERHLMSIKGHCLCGDVQYEIEGKISPIWLCHCSKCRRNTGSAFHAAAMCRPEQFRWLKGEDAFQEYADTPDYVTRFCRRCGGPVPILVEKFGIVMLHAGALDEASGRTVAHHIFAGSKAPWYEITDQLPQYDEHKP